MKLLLIASLLLTSKVHAQRKYAWMVEGTRAVVEGPLSMLKLKDLGLKVLSVEKHAADKNKYLLEFVVCNDKGCSNIEAPKTLLKEKNELNLSTFGMNKEHRVLKTLEHVYEPSLRKSDYTFGVQLTEYNSFMPNEILGRVVWDLSRLDNDGVSTKVINTGEVQARIRLSITSDKH